MYRRRILLLVIALIAGFSVISTRLVWLQGMQWRSYHLEAVKTHRRVWADPAPRGRIVDRHGAVIARDVPSHEIVYALDDLEKVRWVCRRLHREIRRDRAGLDFPHDVDHLWDTLQALRAEFRPQFASGEALEPRLWLSNIPASTAAHLARAIDARPANYPGIIVDREAREILIDPSKLFAGEISVRRVSLRLGRDPDRLWDSVWKRYQKVQDPKLDITRREEIYRYLEHELAGNVPPDLVEEIVTHPDRFPGLRVREVPRRAFDGPAGIARLIGRVGTRRALDEDRWDEAREPIIDRHRFRTLEPVRILQERAHHSEDLVGHDGIERENEDTLRGRTGGTLWIVDHRQTPQGDPLDVEPPIPGRELSLTLDLELCAKLDELAARRDPYAASLLVADVRSGEILGWSSYPSATPDVFRDPEEYQRLIELERGHFYDRPAAYAMDPGSTFKVLIALASLEAGVIERDHSETCNGVYDPNTPGRLRCNNHYHGLDLDVEEALMRSCNVFFYRVGGDRLGIYGMTDWARRVGFWQPIDLGLGAQAVGKPPRSSAPSVAIGRTFTTTPLQMLRFTTIVANRGHDPGLSLIAGRRATPLAPFLLRPETWRSVIRGMERAAHDPSGTAAKPQYGLSRFDCAVKTGTAGMSKGEVRPRWRVHPDGSKGEWNRAWLIGFAPVENPEVAFVVGLERVEGHGGDECAPIAAEILDWLEQHRELRLSVEPSSEREGPR